MLISGQMYLLTIYVHIRVVNSGRYDSPHIQKSFLDHDSNTIPAKQIGVSFTVLDVLHVTRVYQCNPHVPSLTASLVILVLTR